MRAIVTYLPPSSALARSIHGEKVEWSATEHLLAAAVDALHGANWQRGGGKGKRPKPVPRPGDDGKRQGRTLGTASLTPDELDALLARPRRAVGDAVPPLPATCRAEGCVRADIKARGLCGMHYQRWRRAERST